MINSKKTCGKNPRDFLFKTIDNIPILVYNVFATFILRGVVMSEYISAVDTAKKWNISRRRVILLCKTNRIPKAILIGNSWAIPADAKKPPDARITHGKYVGKYRERNK